MALHGRHKKTPKMRDEDEGIERMRARKAERAKPVKKAKSPRKATRRGK